MHGSRVHEAPYQLIHLGHLGYKTDRKAADRELHGICRQDGMFALRA
jgi:hypothetical protein